MIVGIIEVVVESMQFVVKLENQKLVKYFVFLAMLAQVILLRT